MVESGDLADGDVHVWYARPETCADEADRQRLEALLTPEELGRRQRFVFERDQQLYLVAHALLRSTLSRYTGIDPLDWRFATNAYGRPDVDSPATWRSLRFNISHTTGLVAVAVTKNRDVGVDVEWNQRPGLGVELADRYFSPAEVKDLLRVATERQKRTFFDYWTLKESYIKARGMGLSLPLDRFSFHLAGEGPVTISIDPDLADDAGSWYFEKHYPTGEHTLAVAARRAGRSAPHVSIRETVP